MWGVAPFECSLMKTQKGKVYKGIIRCIRTTRRKEETRKMQIQINKRDHAETLEGLKEVLECKRDSESGVKFYSFIKSLKQDFGQEVSTKYLRSLFNGDDRAKTKRLNYLMRKAGLKTKRLNRYYDKTIYQKSKVEVVSYGHLKGSGVYDVAVKDVRTLNVGRECFGHFMEVLFIILI